MRDRMLHDALRTLTADAAYLLEEQLNAGEEIPFEVGESAGPGREQGRDRGNGVKLFAYRPMTGEFVSSHADQLRALPSFEHAAQNLARTRGMIAYLRVRDEPVLDVGELTHARLGALAFLSAVWSDAERFDAWEERFGRAYGELESVALAERLVTTVFVPVFGVVLDCDSVNLGAGVELMPPDELDPACADRFSDSVIGADSYCSISVDAPSDAPAPMAAVRLSARALLTALRMFKPGSVSLGLTAQADVGGAWQQVSLPFTGRSREEAWSLLPGEDEELRQFINAVRRVDRRTRVAWSLKRFEMGLERTVPAEGLTDFLAALRALLEAHDDTGKAALPARVSALCARDSERVHVRAAVEAAFALEKLAVDGRIGRADRKRLAKQPPLEVIADTERYLRALLHDLVCGYLASDLKKLADEILLADGEPTGVETAAHEPVYLEPVPDPGAPPAPDPTETVEFEAVFDDTAEIQAIDIRDDEPAEDNVWTLRPAAEVAPAPEVSVEDVEPEPLTEPDARMHEIAEQMVERFDDEFSASMGEVVPDSIEPDAGDDSAWLDSPELVSAEEIWDPSPERREPRGTSDLPVADGEFTFDFKKLETPAAPQREEIVPPRASEPQPGAAQDPDFPIPEFGISFGRGPAARESDAAVDGGAQQENFMEIMDENFTPPPRDLTERPTTPLARDGRPHLTALDGARPEPHTERGPREEPAAVEQPRTNIVHPEIFASRAPAPADPQETVEWDALAHEPSAEESAQLAWSEQFVKGTQESPVVEVEPPAAQRDGGVEPLSEAEMAPIARLELAPPPQPTAEHAAVVEPPAAAETDDADAESEPQQTSGHAPLSSEQARTHKIGPATIEFRPVVDPDTDDPDDFAGAV